MGKKPTGGGDGGKPVGKAAGKAAAKAGKKAKAMEKVERKLKKAGKGKAHSKGADDDDLEAILDEMRRAHEDAHKVTEELAAGPPSRRANATLVACPTGNYLWCIGGEFFSEDKRAHFYQDVFRYSPEKDEWRKFVSPTCPGPRSAHAAAVTSVGGGQIFIHGGEFSSPTQTSFHHYRDFWSFDVRTHQWTRIDTRGKTPPARSGHRMAAWKHYIFLFGGFFDPGLVTKYLNDLWVFDTHEYTWRQIEFKPNEARPSPRSGFSFLPVQDGILLHGGYCKEHIKGQRTVGVMLEDTWFLNLSLPEAVTSAEPSTSRKSAPVASPPLVAKWERRRRPAGANAPNARAGATMALWLTRGAGVLFGGVTDEDVSEEGLKSIFHNDMYAYIVAAKGRWMPLRLQKPKKAKQARRRRKEANKATPAQPILPAVAARAGDKDKGEDYEHDSDDEGTVVGETTSVAPSDLSSDRSSTAYDTVSLSGNTIANSDELDPDDPALTVPIPRYNAMLAILRNTLYIYGGIYERGKREYTLDDFYTLNLDKLDRFVCLKPAEITIPEGDPGSSSSSSEDDDEGSGSSDSDTEGTHLDDDATEVDEDEVREALEQRRKADLLGEPDDEEDAVVNVVIDPNLVIFSEPNTVEYVGLDMEKNVDESRAQEDDASTPRPGETLAMFYARSKEHWTAQARAKAETRGKELRREAFPLAQERYNEYEPVLRQLEGILLGAGLDQNDLRRSAATSGPPGKGAGAGGGENRNRR